MAIPKLHVEESMELIHGTENKFQEGRMKQVIGKHMVTTAE
jgi:hypothetical protein